MPPRRRPRIDRTGSGVPVSIASLEPPAGGPPRLEKARLVARCRSALGEELGRHLVAVSRDDAKLILSFDGERWASAARANARRIAPRVASIAQGARLAFETAQAGGGATCDARSRPAEGERRHASRSPPSERERLQALATKIKARRSPSIGPDVTER